MMSVCRFNYSASLQRIQQCAPDISRMLATAEQLLLQFYRCSLPAIDTSSTHTGTVPSVHEPSVDLLSKYCPWLLTKFKPANVAVDGNCLFRSVSFALYGHEQFYIHLRLLSAIEVLHNSSVYDSHSTDFYGPFAADRWLCLPTYSCFVADVVRDGAYSDMLTVLALSNVIQKPIQTFWPITHTPGETSPLTKLVVGHNVHTSRHPVHIMWTVSQGAKSCDNGYSVDHFVPLIAYDDGNSTLIDLDVHKSGSADGNDPFVDAVLYGLNAKPVPRSAIDYENISVALSESDSGDIPQSEPTHCEKLDNGQFLSAKECIECIRGDREPCVESIPSGPKNNTYFVINNQANNERQNNNKRRLFHDDCGAWKSIRQKERYFDKETGKEVVKRNGTLCSRKQKNGQLIFEPVGLNEQTDVFVLTHYESKLDRDYSYRRRVTWLSDQREKAIVEYLGIFPAHVTNHGNAKCAGEYIRTDPQVLNTIQQHVQTSRDKPKKIYTQMDKANTQEPDKPRNLKQVQNITCAFNKANGSAGGFNSKANFADEMQQLCTKVVDDDFIKGVFFCQGHSPSVVLYTESQLCDLKRCCGCETPDSIRSVMCVDRTFNLSNLFLTVIVFKNNTVIRKTSHEPPLFIGPMFLHGDGQQETYLQFFSHLAPKIGSTHSTEVRADMKILTGSDEERALVQALQAAFPSAQHLFCMLHCKGNVQQHLTDVGVSIEHRQHIISLLFGSDGATLAGDEATLEARISNVLQYVRFANIDVCNYLTVHVFPKIRSNCELMWNEKWLGQAAWNNNNAESINHQLKLAVDWKPQRLTDLVDHLRDAVNLQYSSLRRALFGQGDLQLVPQFNKHYVPFVKWNGLSQDKQNKLFESFLRDKGPRAAETTVTSSDGQLTVKGHNNVKRKPNQTKRPRAVRTNRKPQ